MTGSTSTTATITSTTFTDTNLTATITPSSTSSKILIFICQAVYIYRNSPQIAGGVRLVRNGTMINQGHSDGTGGLNPYLEGTGVSAQYYSHWWNMHHIDSPSSTSALTYKTQGQVRQTSNGSTIQFQTASNTTNLSTIVLQEIAQ